MSNALRSMLTRWYEKRHESLWVLGTIYHTEGSAYRKAGAMMMMNDQGDQYGLLSGGCLEADIKLRAKKVIHTQKSITLVYDARDEEDIASQMDLGCGGKIEILLQPVLPEYDLGLSELLAHLDKHEGGVFTQLIPGKSGETQGWFQYKSNAKNQPSRLIEKDGQTYLEKEIGPEPHLLIIGGGPDAIPLSKLAKEIGWYVSLCDPRPAQGRNAHFSHVDFLMKNMDHELEDYARSSKVNACILMSHHVKIDAKALTALRFVPICYLGILGPSHRCHQVLKTAQLSEQDLPCPLNGPAGLDIGGELPESVALSILAQCHARFYEKTGQAFQKGLP